MQQTNGIEQGSATLRQSLAAIGILVALAITVPIFGILMIPGVALAALARAIVDAAPRLRAPAPRERADAGTGRASRLTASPPLGAAS